KAGQVDPVSAWCKIADDGYAAAGSVRKDIGAGTANHGAGAGQVGQGVAACRADEQLILTGKGCDQRGAERAAVEEQWLTYIGEGVAVNIDVVQPVDVRVDQVATAVGPALESDRALGGCHVIEGVARHRHVGDAISAAPPRVLERQAAVMLTVGSEGPVD